MQYIYIHIYSPIYVLSKKNIGFATCLPGPRLHEQSVDMGIDWSWTARLLDVFWYNWRYVDIIPEIRKFEKFLDNLRCFEIVLRCFEIVWDSLRYVWDTLRYFEISLDIFEIFWDNCPIPSWIQWRSPRNFTLRADSTMADVQSKMNGFA